MTSELKNKTYTTVQDELDDLNASKKEKLISLGLAFITSLLLVAGPITLFANLLMFNDLVATFSFLIAVFVIIFVFLIDFIYLKLLSKRRVLGLYHVWAIDLMWIILVVFAVYYFLAKLVFKIY